MISAGDIMQNFSMRAPNHYFIYNAAQLAKAYSHQFMKAV